MQHHLLLYNTVHSCSSKVLWDVAIAPNLDGSKRSLQTFMVSVAVSNDDSMEPQLSEAAYPLISILGEQV